ncbi:MAG: hypothetical protein COB60_08845 [Flavobacteriaceae bacterium]|nr:MAG: hypothetical protein COB60_08845 [Flavobacteriaceae bacterium]
MKYISKNIVFSVLALSFFGVSTLTAQNDNATIEQLIEKKRTYNQTKVKSKGFVIQLYNGNESKAYEVQQKFDVLFPQYTSKMKVDLPDWKVQIINFKTRLAADRALNLFRQEFIGANIPKS